MCTYVSSIWLIEETVINQGLLICLPTVYLNTLLGCPQFVDAELWAMVNGCNWNISLGYTGIVAQRYIGFYSSLWYLKVWLHLKMVPVDPLISRPLRSCRLLIILCSATHFHRHYYITIEKSVLERVYAQMKDTNKYYNWNVGWCCNLFMYVLLSNLGNSMQTCLSARM